MFTAASRDHRATILEPDRGWTCVHNRPRRDEIDQASYRNMTMARPGDCKQRPSRDPHATGFAVP